MSDNIKTILETFAVDYATLTRALPPPLSPARTERLRQFYTDWDATLDAVGFDALNFEERADYLLFRNHLRYEQRQLEIQTKKQEEMAPLLPFATAILDLETARRRLEPVEGAHVAACLDALTVQIAALITVVRHASEQKKEQNGEQNAAEQEPDAVFPFAKLLSRAMGNRAAVASGDLIALLQTWFSFYDGYDPLFSWWVREPFKEVLKALQEYADVLRETLVGIKPDNNDVIIGNPIGREALLNELAHELIPYTPEELIAIGDREFAWCKTEMRKAAQDLGYGDDWHAALEFVKTRHVAPGAQTTLVRDLAHEAIAFVEARELVTIPALARECWRMEMMSPERQKVSPFFLGGEVIIVSFPTDSMTHTRKRMSLRGNNRHFARATVQHELIPGHHLQLYMADRHRTYRQVFHTPFYVEGWTLHWEMLLWELDFPQSPEDRIGMLFWRMHRCARITFSLRFHLELMPPQQCIDLLVEQVGHERENAIAEVRRSFGDEYPPLYQCAYMIGGLQMHTLYRELVESGAMSARAFHDAVLKQNAIPIEMLRACLTEQTLPRDFTTSWRFA